MTSFFILIYSYQSQGQQSLGEIFNMTRWMWVILVLYWYKAWRKRAWHSVTCLWSSEVVLPNDDHSSPVCSICGLLGDSQNHSWHPLGVNTHLGNANLWDYPLKIFVISCFAYYTMRVSNLREQNEQKGEPVAFWGLAGAWWMPTEPGWDRLWALEARHRQAQEGGQSETGSPLFCHAASWRISASHLASAQKSSASIVHQYCRWTQANSFMHAGDYEIGDHAHTGGIS